ISYFTLPGWFNRLAGIEHPFNAPAIDYYMKAIMEIVKQSRAKRFKQQNLVQLLIDSSADAETVNSDSFDSLTASMEKGKERLFRFYFHQFIYFQNLTKPSQLIARRRSLYLTKKLSASL